MRFLSDYKDTGILNDGSIIDFLPDGTVIAYYSKYWKVCGSNVHKFKTKNQAILIFEEIEKELTSHMNGDLQKGK